MTIKVGTPEAGSIHDSKVDSEDGQQVRKRGSHFLQVMSLSFASSGAVYGDIGTSPLYVMDSFALKDSTPSKKEVYGMTSIIFWLFVILVFIKYALIVLRFGPNASEGGQVAIYAKIARSLHFGPRGVSIPGSYEPSDMEILGRTNTMHSTQEGNGNWRQNPKLVRAVSSITMTLGFLGCSLVFSDGLSTPTTTASTAVSGIQVAAPSFNAVVGVSEAILLFSFLIQFFGSTKLSFSFAPIMFTWLICLAVCGIYNISKYDPSVFKSFNPYYAIELLKSGGIDNLSGGMLAITGTEAMFADVGHFGKSPIQIGVTFSSVCLMLCYLGQAAYLTKNPEEVSNIFYASIPGGVNKPFYWIMFVLAILSTIVASQALISGVQSIVSQLINSDCWPKFKVIRFSKSHRGKVFIPAANLLLCIGVVACTAAYQNSNNVTAAYGLGISLDFLVTTTMITLCLIFVYEVNPSVVVWFPLIFLPLEWSIAVANFKKVPHGAWFPLMMCAIFMTFSIFWRYFRNLTVLKQISSRIPISSSFSTYNQRVVRTDNDEENVELWHPHFELSSGVNKGNSPDNQSRATIIYSDLQSQTSISPNTFPAVYGQSVHNFIGIPGVVIFCVLKTCGIPAVDNEEKVLVVPSKIAGHYKAVIRFGFTEEMQVTEALLNSMWSQISEMRRKPQDFEVVHIFEKTCVRNKSYPKTRNILRLTCQFCRRFIVEYLYAPINAVYQNDDLVVPDEEDKNRKLFIGGILRI